MSSASGSGAPRLGRGLEALLGVAPGSAELVAVPVGAVERSRRQPRRSFDDAAVDELAASVRVHGLVQPIVVRPLAHGRYELVAGERRWRAACRAGLATVPALVRETDDRESLLLALVENVAREDLSALDEARAYAVLQDEFGLGLGEIAERVGRSKPAVSNRLRLLDLPDDVLTFLASGDLTEGHARAVLAVYGNEERRRLAQRIVQRGLSVRAAERAARTAGAHRKRRRTRAIDRALALRAQNVLEALSGAPVRVAGGRLEVVFDDETALAEIVEALESVLARRAA